MDDLNSKIIEWANEKGIDNPKTQLIKIMEEFGELADELADYFYNGMDPHFDIDGSKKRIADAIGDTYITILIESHILGYEYPFIDVYHRAHSYSVGRDVARTIVDMVRIIGHIAKNISHDRTIYNYRDSLSDIVSDLFDITKQVSLNFEDCVRGAYEEIKNRNGKTVDGNFIKEQ